MKISPESIEVKIVSGPDRLGLANAMFDKDELTDELRTVYFQFETKLGELKGSSIQLRKLERESGNQTKQWCFEGFVSEKARERSGYALAGAITGYYNLNDRRGWIRFKRV